jgi:hypothetical protein
MEGVLFEEVDFETNGDDLAEIGGVGEVFAAGTEMGEGEMAGAGEFEARGEDGAVEVDNGTDLDLDAKLHGGGREGLSVNDPSTTFGEGGGQGGKEAVTFFIAKALDFERLHG